MRAKAQKQIRQQRQPGSTPSRTWGSGGEKASSPGADSDDDEDEYPMRDKLIFCIGAGVLMILFAVHFGIIQVGVVFAIVALGLYWVLGLSLQVLWKRGHLSVYFFATVV